MMQQADPSPYLLSIQLKLVRQITHSLLVFSALYFTPLRGDAQVASDEATSVSEKTRPSESSGGVNANRSLRDILTEVATRSVERLRPDVRNGLIRIAVPTARGTSQDRPSREAFTALLAQLVSEQPNVFISDVASTVQTLRQFDSLSVPLTVERSISLGQHLGVRYVLITELSAGETAQSLTLKTRLVSIKRRGVVFESAHQITQKSYTRLRALTVFDEEKLSATWRSALLPGWGQLYQGRTGSGVAYLGLTTALISGALWAQAQGQAAEERYQENISDTVQYRAEANQHYTRARLMWGALGVTWLSATLSAYLQGEDRSHIQLNLDPTRGGVSLSGDF